MKKFLSLLLALAAAAAMSLNASAAGSIGSSNGTQKIDVRAKYVDGVSSGIRYNVDIRWDAMEFTYTVSGTKTWNPEKHDYDIKTSDAWAGTGNEITVTNHSNTAVTASFSFAPLSGYTGLTGAFSANSFQFPSAENKALNASELTGKTTLTLSGTLADTVTTMTKVGTVTVTIS